MAKVKKGDTVVVIAGKDKGTKGKVLSVLLETDRVIVEGVNRVVRHTKVGTSSRGATTGGLIHQEAPIHISNVKPAKEDAPKKAAKKAAAKSTKKVETEAVEATEVEATETTEEA